MKKNVSSVESPIRMKVLNCTTVEGAYSAKTMR
jgi:hypothetical protein